MPTKVAIASRSQRPLTNLAEHGLGGGRTRLWLVSLVAADVAAARNVAIAGVTRSRKTMWRNHADSGMRKSGLGGKIDALGKKIETAEQLRDFATLRALAESLDESWLLSSAAAEHRWRDDARQGMHLVKLFQGKAAQMLATGRDAALLAAPVLDGLSLASSLRIAALAAAGEMPAAYQAAENDARTLDELTGDIGLADLARTRMADWGAMPGTAEWTHALDRAVEASRADVNRLREREVAAATRAAPPMALESRNASARDWLASARAEDEAPLLLLQDGELGG
jgi:hypothetical protein